MLIKLSSVLHSTEFEHVFLLNPSSESTFAQYQSCRSFCSLQLLFWPNFKLFYENLSFGRSRSESILPKTRRLRVCKLEPPVYKPVLRPKTRRFRFCSVRRPYRRLCRWRRHASPRRRPHRRLSSPRRCTGQLHFGFVVLLPRAASGAKQTLAPPLTAPAIPSPSRHRS